MWQVYKYRRRDLSISEYVSTVVIDEHVHFYPQTVTRSRTSRVKIDFWDLNAKSQLLLLIIKGGQE